MIDIHCHIIPGIDDGPGSMEESLEMAKIAADDGISYVIATPHQIDGLYQESAESIENKIFELNALLEDNRINLKILPGSDLHISSDLIQKIAEKKLLTLNHSSYALIEFPGQLLKDKITRLMDEMLDNGIIPIISHPERNFILQKDPNLLYEFVKKGIYAQVTAMSLTGEFGHEIKRIAQKMLTHNLVQIIATDAHSKVFRPPILSKGLQKATRLIGEEIAFNMVETYPLKIINGEKFCPPEPQKIRNFFGFYF